ncbi:hypothetical protein ACUH97_00375 [Dermabacteraceae bacterium P13088]
MRDFLASVIAALVASSLIALLGNLSGLWVFETVGEFIYLVVGAWVVVFFSGKLWRQGDRR